MYIDFKKIFFEQICFSHHQIELVFPKFDKKNLSRWQKKEYIVKLRNGLYTFPEYVNQNGFNLYAANRIYQPSYISLHYVLNFYGIIPEVINSVTSMSTLKSKQFNNSIGKFSFQTVQPKMFFGYEIKRTNSFDFQMACPEKALIDIFYLYPMYNTAKEIEQLRFDDSVLKEIVNLKKMNNFLKRIKNETLNYKVELMKKVYEL